MLFNTFDEALYCLAIPDDLKCLTIAHCKGSYEAFTQNGRVLYCIGQGRKRSPGHPGGHQILENQVLLTVSGQRLYPAFHIFSNYIVYMGNYRLLSFKKTMSFEGFMYYEYKLFRENKYMITHLPIPEPVAMPMAKPVLEVKLAPVVSTGFSWFPSCTS